VFGGRNPWWFLCLRRLDGGVYGLANTIVSVFGGWRKFDDDSGELTTGVKSFVLNDCEKGRGVEERVTGD